MVDCSAVRTADFERDNLGDIVKHKHCELIKRWADGAIIQFKSYRTSEWIDCDSEPSWDMSVQYRVKPETVRYRVSLHKDYLGCFYTMVSDDSEEENGNRTNQFVRWLTDWQEVEV